MIALTKWLKKPDAEKVLLVEIVTASSPIYIADTSYITEPADLPANQPYTPVIAPNGIPRLVRRIQEVWGGRSLPSWGPLELATQFVGEKDLALMNLRGNKISALITGPRQNVNRVDAVTILTGRIGPYAGNADGGLTIEIQDEQARWDEIELPANQYDGSESVSFPPANIGLSKPIVLGLCRNVPAILINQSSYVYQVHDGSVEVMQAIDAVYDNGVSVAYTADLNAGTFTLAAVPAGVITADVKGVKAAGVWLNDTALIIDWLAKQYGGLSAANINITNLPADVIGKYINGVTRVSDVITQLMQGVLGWWGFDRLGTLTAQLFNVPAGGGTVFGDTKHLSDVTWTEEDEIIWSVPVRYYRNWLQLEPAASVNVNTASWMRSQGYLSRVENVAIKAAYKSTSTAQIIETYFDTEAGAQTVANRALALFGLLRRRGRVAVPIAETLLELGAEVNLTQADVMTGDYIIVGLADIWDGEIPMMDLEVWG